MYRENEKWKTQFSRNLNAIFLTNNHKNWVRCEIFFLHVKSVERQLSINDRSVREWVQILRKTGWYTWVIGDYHEVERMYKKSTRTLNKVLDRENVETSYSLGMLTSTFWNQGRWKEIEELEIQVMKTRKRVLGKEHPSTLTSIVNLTSTYRNQEQ